MSISAKLSRFAFNRTLLELKSLGSSQLSNQLSSLQSHLTGIEICDRLHSRRFRSRPSIAPYWNWNKRLSLGQMLALWVLQSHLTGIEIWSRRLYPWKVPHLQSHLTGIEIADFQLFDLTGKLLQSHLTGIEIGRAGAGIAAPRVLQSHLTGIEIQHFTTSMPYGTTFNRTLLELKWAKGLFLGLTYSHLQSHLTGIEISIYPLFLCSQQNLQSHLTGIEMRNAWHGISRRNTPSIAPYWNWNKNYPHTIDESF